MKKNLQSLNKTYFEIREKADLVSEKLEKLHQEQLNCKSGCDMCCMDYSIFPVEYYSILNELKTDNFISPNRNTDNEKCVFLHQHVCEIYKNRPLICRTHGLPLLYTNEEGEWELSACELNFTDFDFAELSIDTTFPQDKFNSKLFLLNQKFIKEFKEKDFGDFDLIPIKNLLNDLNN
jgi:Fe-S-cluster containining protein